MTTAANQLPEHVVALTANFRKNAKVRALLANPDTAAEALAIAAKGSWSEFASWLEAHGVELSKSNIKSTRDRLQDVCKDLLAEDQAVQLIERDAVQRGSSLSGATRKQYILALAGLLRGVKNPDSEEGRTLIINGLNALNGAETVDVRKQEAEGKKETLKLKREELDLAVQKYKDSAKKGVDKALDEFADVLKKFPKLREQYVQFRASVRAAVEGAA